MMLLDLLMISKKRILEKISFECDQFFKKRSISTKISNIAKFFVVRMNKMILMYKEQRIQSLRDLKNYIYALDEDEGIRIFGKVKGYERGGFIFVGIYLGKYCVRVCDRVWDHKLKSHSIGNKNNYLYFSNVEKLLNFLEDNIEKPLRAWLY